MQKIGKYILSGSNQWSDVCLVELENFHSRMPGIKICDVNIRGGIGIKLNEAMNDKATLGRRERRGGCRGISR